jgi:hypothetical protein
MVQFSEAFPDPEIVAALRRQLGWAHFKLLIPLKDALQRDFYAEMCRIEGWSTRALAQKIEGMLYERTALSKKPERLIRQELAALREKDAREVLQERLHRAIAAARQRLVLGDTADLNEDAAPSRPGSVPATSQQPSRGRARPRKGRKS